MIVRTSSHLCCPPVTVLGYQTPIKDWDPQIHLPLWSPRSFFGGRAPLPCCAAGAGWTLTLVDPPADLSLFLVADARVPAFQGSRPLDSGCARRGCRITRRSGRAASSQQKGPTMRHGGIGRDADHHDSAKGYAPAQRAGLRSVRPFPSGPSPASTQRGALRIMRADCPFCSPRYPILRRAGN